MQIKVKGASVKPLGGHFGQIIELALEKSELSPRERAVCFTGGQRHLLDNYLRYIIAWNLSSTRCAEDAVDMLDLALAASGCGESHVRHKPRLLDDDGHSYIAADSEVQISVFVEH